MKERPAPPVPCHEHDLEFVSVREYEVWRCPGCGAERLVPLLDGWQEK